MRANEFIVERKQLNELAPLAFLAPSLPPALGFIATAGLGSIAMWALTAYATMDTVNDMRRAAEKSGSNNPLDWPEDIQFELLGSFIGMALFASLPFLKSGWNKIWNKIPNDAKKEAFEKVAPTIQKNLDKAPAKDPNKIDRPFSKDAAPAQPTGTTPPPGGTGAFDKMAKDLTSKPKNPNWVEKPYQKESLAK